MQQWQATVNKPEEARTAVLLAAYFAEKKDFEKAVNYYKHALAVWQKLDDQKEMNTIQAALDKLENSH